MSSEVFTKKQRQLISLLKHDRLKRLNILEGSVSSGKTWISLVVWAFWVASQPKEHQYLMCAKSLKTLKRNCLSLLQSLVGKKYFSYSLSKKEGVLFGRTILLEGANDARSEEKIRGLTIGGAYCDELTLFPEDFFAMLLSRLRVKGAKLIATTNPDNPNHWLKKKYLDKADELNILDIRFLLDDNTFLDADYVSALKKEYTGVYKQRFIYGLWVTAEGAVYSYFNDNKDDFIIDGIDKNKIAFATIGVDFGGSQSAHAFVCNGYTKGFKEVISLDEYYKTGAQVLTPGHLEDDFVDFVRRCKESYRVVDVYCDSAEQLLIKGLRLAAQRERLGVNIHNARKGKVTERIRFFTRLMGSHRYKVLKNCSHLIEALENAVWNGRSLDDERLDDGTTNIDSLDAMEYASESMMSTIFKDRGK